ncbi:MAG: GDYXXLXY domain-containing protein [Omnitrophica bacterium]|nr:GDYXXLXY domain-containing protein [Candidatus Omnitrophota bacterium]
MKKKNLLFIILGLQIFFLSSMICFHSVKLSRARRIFLKTIPYDPVSLFRGHFAVLRYEISTLPKELLKDTKSENLRSGDELFVVLKKQGDYWQAESIYKNRPKDKHKLYIRGRLPSYYNYSYAYRKTLNLHYGIESFFLNEKSAQEVDRVNRRTDWRQVQDLRKKRIEQLDPETKRIYKSGISRWSLDKWEKEFELWVKEDIISKGVKDIIMKKYNSALLKIGEVTRNPQRLDRKPVIVEVAIDKNGYGYPTRLLHEGKEYR